MASLPPGGGSPQASWPIVGRTFSPLPGGSDQSTPPTPATRPRVWRLRRHVEDRGEEGVGGVYPVSREETPGTPIVAVRLTDIIARGQRAK